MECDWDQLEQPTEPQRVAVPYVDMGHSRIILRTADVQVVVTRNAMVRLGQGIDKVAIDCNRFQRWRSAASACADLVRGTMPTGKREEWTLILAAVSLDQQRSYFHFMQVDVPLLRHPQEQVHGLLGQRAISPTGAQETSDAPRVGHQGEGSITGHYTEYMAPSLAEHSSLRFGRFAC